MTLADLDKKYIWHPFTQMGAWQRDQPLIIERGEGNYLIDIDGNRYIDGVSSLWVNVHGHGCPEIDDAIKDQLGRIAHSTLLGLSNVPAIELAAELVRISPKGLSRVFYSDSGSTAVEVALKLAFQYWQLAGRKRKTHFVALDQAYHGDTIGAVGVGGVDLFHRTFHPLLFQCLKTSAPHAYRAHADAEDNPERCRETCLAELSQLLKENGEEIAALIIEPRIQGAAGMLVHPPGYLRGVADLCKQHDVLLICDEVATGFGRTGSMFSCAAENIRPDLMAVAKGLSGGYLPVAATLASERIYDMFSGKNENVFFHGHTYTGNPLACAAARASLKLMEERHTVDRVNDCSKILSGLLAKRIEPLAPVGSVRQLGLMVGIELVSDRTTKSPFPVDQRVGQQVCANLRRRGVILRPLGDVVVLMPPLSITTAELSFLVSAVADAIVDVLR